MILKRLLPLLALSAVARAATPPEVASMPPDNGLAPGVTEQVTGGHLRRFILATDHPLRDSLPPGRRIELTENADDARVRTGSEIFDAVYALACHEARLSAVSRISSAYYAGGVPIEIEAYQAAERTNFVWTRDTAYAVHLGLAAVDPQRCWTSLQFKTSKLKRGLGDPDLVRIVQDTGSGGSWPVSTDRVVWALGVRQLADYLPEAQRKNLARTALRVLRDTLHQDEAVVRDPVDGLFRGEMSFCDWREQTYPGWTRDNVIAIARSKSFSTNVVFRAAYETAAQFAGELGESDAAREYSKRAEELKEAINRRFFDVQTNTYAAYLLTDGLTERPTARLDLLGTSLAILTGVTDTRRAVDVLSAYPVGAYGPPVVWPIEPGVPIYHNGGIWPFVTAYWTLAAAKAGHAPAVEAGIASLVRSAARNLANLENLDFVTGEAFAKHDGVEGPVINSRGQLWSVAGALGVVHHVVFGLETQAGAIRFLPKIPGRTAQLIGGHARVLELNNFSYLGRRIDVRVELPPLNATARGFLEVGSIELNGRPVTEDFIPVTALADRNRWVVRMAPPSDAPLPPLHHPKAEDFFAPSPPQWVGEGVVFQDGYARLSFQHASPERVVFRIYRNGHRVADAVPGPSWRDSSDDGSPAEYAVEAADKITGLVSHPTPVCRLTPAGRITIFAAGELRAVEGEMGSADHWTKWGKPHDVLRTPTFVARSSGRHVIQVEFSNGTGPVSSGVTCGVKLLEVIDADTGRALASNYVVFPHTVDWQHRNLTAPCQVLLEAGGRYEFLLREDGFTQNMSYLAFNRDYTRYFSGGDSAINSMDIFSVRVTDVHDWRPGDGGSANPW